MYLILKNPKFFQDLTKIQKIREDAVVKDSAALRTSHYLSYIGFQWRIQHGVFGENAPTPTPPPLHFLLGRANLHHYDMPVKLRSVSRITIILKGRYISSLYCNFTPNCHPAPSCILSASEIIIIWHINNFSGGFLRLHKLLL